LGHITAFVSVSGEAGEEGLEGNASRASIYSSWEGMIRQVKEHLHILYVAGRLAAETTWSICNSALGLLHAQIARGLPGTSRNTRHIGNQLIGSTFQFNCILDNVYALFCVASIICMFSDFIRMFV
jgi:hypothetical protein